MPLKVGLVLFPQLTQLDLTGPYEVFARLPQSQTFVVAATPEPVPSEHGLAIIPTCTFADAPQFDIVCVPGGVGVNAMMEDRALLGFLQTQARGAKYVTSVCTGALVLGAAGLLHGVTAGIDFGLAVAAEIYGRAVAEKIQLMIEYDPAPVTSGSPKSASADLVRQVTQDRAQVQAARRAIAERAAQRLAS